MAFEDMTDKELVDYIRPDRSSGGNQAAQAEMQRRQVEAIRQFNRSAERQTRVVIWFTVVIAVFTVVIAALTAVLVWKV